MVSYNLNINPTANQTVLIDYFDSLYFRVYNWCALSAWLLLFNVTSSITKEEAVTALSLPLMGLRLTALLQVTHPHPVTALRLLEVMAMELLLPFQSSTTRKRRLVINPWAEFVMSHLLFFIKTGFEISKKNVVDIVNTCHTSCFFFSVVAWW